MPRMVSWAKPVFWEKVTEGLRPARCSTVWASRSYQLGTGQRAHGQRDRGQIALAAPGRGDDGVLLQRHLQGLRHFGGFAGAHPDDATRGHEAGRCRGQIVVPVGQIPNLESPFSIGPPGPFHGSADGDSRVGQTSAGRVGYHPGDGSGRLRGRWISCPENNRQDGRKPHPGAAVDHTSIMCAGCELSVWVRSRVRQVALEGTMQIRHVRGKGGAGDGDRTRDIELGKLAFYR